MIRDKMILPESCDRVEVTLHGDVLLDGVKLTPALKNKRPMVRIYWHGMMREVPIDLLVIYTYVGCKLPFVFISRIVVMYVDGDSRNVVPSNLVYKYDGLVEYPGLAGFYYIPYHNQYLVSKTSGIFSLISSSKMSLTPVKGGNRNSKGGYLYCRLLSDLHQSQIAFYHRLLGLVFLDYDATISELVINHKDGDPSNNSIENIEWATRAQNNQHAFLNGLNTCGSKTVLAKNLRTNEVTRFWSITDAAKKLGYSHYERILYRIRKRPKTVFEDMMAFKFDDGLPWPEFDLRILPERIPGSKARVIARNVFSGDIVIFDGAGDGLRLTGVSAMSILHACERYRYLPIKGWVFRDRETFSGEWPAFSSRDMLFFKENLNSLPKRGYIATDITTGVEEFYPNLLALGVDFSCDRFSVGKIVDKETVVNNKIIKSFYPTGYEFAPTLIS